jgi:diaminopimelate epimerase
MQFWKYHALGNDYLLLDGENLPAPPTPETVRRLCDRHRGVGADGVLLREPDPSGHRLRIFNADGSEAEKSGNGLRIFARYLWDQGAVESETFPVMTAGGVVACRVMDEGHQVAVDMGRVRFDSELIPVAGPPREVIQETLWVGGEKLEYSAATIGNPHCVILREQVSAEEARRLGPLIERHDLFPRHTNVQFVQVLARDRLKLEIWERGSGYTLASGSSSCAAAAVAFRLGRCDLEIAIEMPGGVAKVELTPELDVRLTGGVTLVARGDIFPEALES